jgi:hypothetical protein
VWFGIGIVIYAIYGCRHSKLNAAGVEKKA